MGHALARVFVARNGRHRLANLVLTRDEVTELNARTLKPGGGRRIDLSQSLADDN